jgi:allophanate hydrolase subunit 1
MKLDFSALSRTNLVRRTYEARGQVGTAGTQAFMRASTSPGSWGTSGTGGDKGFATTTAAAA